MSSLSEADLKVMNYHEGQPDETTSNGKDYTYDWTSIHAENFKQCFEQINEKKRALEVGCYEGRTTAMLADVFDEVVGVEPAPRGLLLETAAENENVTICKGLLYDVLNQVGSDFDFVYIDGSHIGQDVMLDVQLAWKKLKIGGVLLIDDYEWYNDPYIVSMFNDGFIDSLELEHKEYRSRFSPKRAVDAWLSVSVESDVFIENYQLAVKKLRNINEHIKSRRVFFSPDD
ncbi:class I SAM-dependent methyltransferase [Photobacterium alginatilyticum]|uniref:class I SAM-dependent methyltransferase n=1 Tax=Photobacterium alginatilyticum TaxID=1775171 RepID=UPI0040688540